MELTMKKISSFTTAIVAFSVAFTPSAVRAEVPGETGVANYSSSSGWRETEAHPLRVAAYIFHPIGWVAREFVFRPLSLIASSTEVTRSVSGFREPDDWKSPSCFSKSDTAPDCRSAAPFNYERTGETALGREVSEVSFPNVLFQGGSRELNEEGRLRAKDIAASLSAQSSVRVILEGHTDDLGFESYNAKLGLDRAKAVQAELESLGIASDRISTISFGETKPVDPKKSEAARARNRRVEVKAVE
jgi:outer membrane protein OmpA-like peptidoglycan-associated protein